MNLDTRKGIPAPNALVEFIERVEPLYSQISIFDQINVIDQLISTTDRQIQSEIDLHNEKISVLNEEKKRLEAILNRSNMLKQANQEPNKTWRGI
jgi:hypothetical protein